MGSSLVFHLGGYPTLGWTVRSHGSPLEVGVHAVELGPKAGGRWVFFVYTSQLPPTLHVDSHLQRAGWAPDASCTGEQLPEATATLTGKRVFGHSKVLVGE